MKQEKVSKPSFSKNFLTMLTKVETEVLKKATTGTIKNKAEKNYDAFVNKQGRLFGVCDKHDVKFDIETGVFNNKDEKGNDVEVKFFKIKKNDKGKFKTSAATTGTPFITITKLCKKFFGDDNNEWYSTFVKAADVNGWTYYVLNETGLKNGDDKEEEKPTETEAKKSTKKATSKVTK